MLHKNKNYLKLAASFWLGVGLMNIIDILKITNNHNAIKYSWIMLGVSILMITICAILIKTKK